MKKRLFVLAAMLSSACAVVVAQEAGPGRVGADGAGRARVIEGSSEWASPAARQPLDSSLKVFFGNAKGGYVAPNPGRSKELQATPTNLFLQFKQIFDGAPYPEVTLPTGNRLLISSEPANAQVKAFVVTAGTTTHILATALLHYNCGSYLVARVHPGMMEKTCDSAPTLTVFFSPNSGPDRALADQIAAWVQTDIANTNQTLPADSPLRVAKVNREMRTLPAS